MDKDQDSVAYVLFTLRDRLHETVVNLKDALLEVCSIEDNLLGQSSVIKELTPSDPSLVDLITLSRHLSSELLLRLKSVHEMIGDRTVLPVVNP